MGIINYKKLMNANPTKLGELINQLGQRIELYEHPTQGQSFPIIAVSHEHAAAANTMFMDKGDFYYLSEYNPIFFEDRFYAAFEIGFIDLQLNESFIGCRIVYKNYSEDYIPGIVEQINKESQTLFIRLENGEVANVGIESDRVLNILPGKVKEQPGAGIRINKMTAGMLKKYLDQVPDDFRVVINSDWKQWDCQICVNFENQIETKTVQLSRGLIYMEGEGNAKSK